MAEDQRLKHAPFSALRGLKPAERPQSVEHPPCPDEAPVDARGEERVAESPTAPVATPVGPAGDDDAAALADAMAGVQPINGRNDYVPSGSGSARPAGGRRLADAAELEALVNGELPFSLHWSEEHVEGLAQGVDRKLLRKLKAGGFSWQAHLDLHGMTRKQARGTVETFLIESQRLGRRCVLLVHGRGLHSEGGIPVLKDALRSWLTRGGISRRVLCFCSALPTDGGLGAVYVLLRR
ncbi:MAG: Smr/MutS family protein [Deltaproteobacteria bacterium]|nr:Smr/MutS family protein [Deltaproteobacteria bacterium]